MSALSFVSHLVNIARENQKELSLLREYLAAAQEVEEAAAALEALRQRQEAVKLPLEYGEVRDVAAYQNVVAQVHDVMVAKMQALATARAKKRAAEVALDGS